MWGLELFTNKRRAIAEPGDPVSPRSPFGPRID